MMRSKPAGNEEGGLPCMPIPPWLWPGSRLRCLQKLFEEVYRCSEEMQEENLTDFAGFLSS